MRLSVTVDRGPADRRLGRLPLRAQRAAQAGARAVAVAIARRASRRGYGFTDRTGTLRRSIGVRTGRSGGASVVATAPYASYVEQRFGGRYAYISRSSRELESRVAKIFNDAVEKSIGT